MGKKGGVKNKGKVSPNTVAKIEARQVLREKIEKDLEPLYDAWRDCALGHFVEVKTATGVVKVYKESPDSHAIRDMFERAFGKPVQPIEGKIDETIDLSEHAAKILAKLEAINENESGQEDDDVDGGDSED